MNDDEVRRVIIDLAEELKKLYKNILKAVILYGSEVRGNAQEDSDIDILVLVDVESEELRSYEDALSDISTEFALGFFKVFSIIDASFKGVSQWKDVSIFYKNVAREGVIL